MKTEQKGTDPETAPESGGAAGVALLERLGIRTQWDLLDLAEKSNPPKEQPSVSKNWCTDVPFSVDGWVVWIFYDCGELDYITYFTAPDGTMIDFWEWDENHPWKNDLMNWRNVGDMHRLQLSAANIQASGA